MAGDKPHYHGHRARFRARVREHGAETLADYELLEGLLFGAVPRGDTKPLAKALLERFGTLNGVLTAPPRALETVPGLKDSGMTEAARRLAREEVVERPVMSSWEQVLAYCRTALGHEATERFHLLFLDKKNILIADETQQRGTVDHTPVYPREVVKRALELGASALILVHNHPT